MANDCDLFIHIMLALRYYHSMMLRGDQSLLRGHNYSTETTSLSTGKTNILFFDKSNRTINLSKKHTLIH